MRVSKSRHGEIKKVLNGIKAMKDCAVSQMLNDMANSFEKDEDIVVFNQEHCQVIAVSHVGGKLKFIFGNGTYVRPFDEAFNGDNYNLVYCVWDAFFNDSQVEGCPNK